MAGPVEIEVMIENGRKDTILEASVGHLKPPFKYNLQQTNNERFSEQKDEVSYDPGNIMDSENSYNREAFSPPNPGYNSPHYQQEYRTWPNNNPQLHHVQLNYNAYGNPCQPMNREYPFHVENRTHCPPLMMVYHGHQHQLQHFQYFVVIDFEATCDKEKKPDPQEIIEFPSVLVNSFTGEIEGCFQTYVRPSYHQNLTDFCKELTGIQQFQVDTGVPLGEALLMHDKWLESRGLKHKSFAVVTWSNWDCHVMLESECRLKRIKKPAYFNNWINLKVAFQKVFGGVRCNLKDAVHHAGLAWEGRPHCGLDDALNTARLLTNLMSRGFRLEITNSLIWPQATPSSPSQRLPKDAPFPPQIQFRAHFDPFIWEHNVHYCHCGVRSSLSIIRAPGPLFGKRYFGCGNWTAVRSPACSYFAYAGTICVQNQGMS